MKRAVMMLAALGATSLTSGCAAMAVGAVASAGVMIHQDRTPGQDIDDAVVSQKVKARLIAFDSAAYSHVDVEVALGEVLLSGTCPTDQDKADAERIAGAVSGAQRVSNQIVVGRNERLAGSAHDEWITARVRAKLIADKMTKGIDYNIETHVGVVYLMGEARTPEEARRVAELASYVGGVTKVVSYVKVREQPLGPRPIDTGAAPIVMADDGAAKGSGNLAAAMESGAHSRAY